MAYVGGSDQSENLPIGRVVLFLTGSTGERKSVCSALFPRWTRIRHALNLSFNPSGASSDRDSASRH